MLFEKTHKNDRTRYLPPVYQSVVLSHAAPNARHLPFKNSCLPGITSILTINTGLMTKSTQGRHKPCDYLGTLVIISSLRGQESTRNRPGRPRSSGPHPPRSGSSPLPQPSATRLRSNGVFARAMRGDACDALARGRGSRGRCGWILGGSGRGQGRDLMACNRQCVGSAS